MSKREEMKVRIDNLSLEEFIKQDEGISLRPYWDVNGWLTIGCGHCLGIQVKDKKDRDKIKLPEWDIITDEQAHKILQDDVSKAELLLFETFPACMNLTTRRYWALTSMMFNLGPVGFNSFKRMRAALDVNDFEEAGKQIIESKAGRQLKTRYGKYSRMMVDG